MQRVPRSALGRPAAIAIAVVALLAVVLLGGGLLGAGPLAGLAGSTGAGAPGGAGPSQLASGPSATAPAGQPGLGASPAATPAPTPSPTPAPPVALVPVTGFRSAAVSADQAEIADILAGKSETYASLELVAADADADLAAAGAVRPGDPGRLVLAPDPATLRSDMAAHPDRLGILRADDVDASVRALGWGDAKLFGVGRVGSLAAWPLRAALAAASPPIGDVAQTAYDPATAWTLFAGGDYFLDRGVYLTVVVNGKGADYPFDGGTVAITGHTCCSSFGWTQPVTKRTGNDGAVRALVKGADLALANFENPAPVNFTWHKSGTVFSADPALISGMADAGIDWVSLGNNHIGDAGANGILQTIAALDSFGIAHSGAGKGTAQVHAPAILTAGGVKVALLSYDTIASYYWQTTPTGVGSAHMTVDALQSDIAAARAAGAQLVIVYPHWGIEYTAKPSAEQTRLGHAAIDAGADLVIGNHPHWAGAMELYKGKPIWYALGNFNFDQNWSEPTMEGITLELTFSGTRLVQAVMRPHLILDHSQPNFMDPAGSGAVVMKQVFDASKGLLPW